MIRQPIKKKLESATFPMFDRLGRSSVNMCSINNRKKLKKEISQKYFFGKKLFFWKKIIFFEKRFFFQKRFFFEQCGNLVLHDI